MAETTAALSGSEVVAHFTGCRVTLARSWNLRDCLCGWFDGKPKVSQFVGRKRKFEVDLTGPKKVCQICRTDSTTTEWARRKGSRKDQRSRPEGSRCLSCHKMAACKHLLPCTAKYRSCQLGPSKRHIRLRCWWSSAFSARTSHQKSWFGARRSCEPTRPVTGRHGWRTVTPSVSDNTCRQRRGFQVQRPTSNKSSALSLVLRGTSCLVPLVPWRAIACPTFFQVSVPKNLFEDGLRSQSRRDSQMRRRTSTSSSTKATSM